jgi:DNA-binding Lrp family transcriptional regulator
MDLSDEDRRLLTALEDGLAAVARPYAELASRAGVSEGEAILRLRRLVATGAVKRLGLVVRHRELGYRANAMAVWDVPDDRLAEAGRRAAALPFVTLCYSRPRRQPVWRYNLFCMVHGRERAEVEVEIATLAASAGLEDCDHEVLFSRRRFKQQGARYFSKAAAA